MLAGEPRHRMERGQAHAAGWCSANGLGHQRAQGSIALFHAQREEEKAESPVVPWDWRLLVEAA